jgi:hypothetical protein
MWDEIFKDISNKYNPRFGQVTVENGYATSEQVKQALLKQREDDLAKRPHRLIGEIMLRKGWMTAKQIEKVLKEMLSREKKE